MKTGGEELIIEPLLTIFNSPADFSRKSKMSYKIGLNFVENIRSSLNHNVNKINWTRLFPEYKKEKREKTHFEKNVKFLSQPHSGIKKLFNTFLQKRESSEIQGVFEIYVISCISNAFYAI